MHAELGTHSDTKPRIVVALVRHGEYAQLSATPSAHQPFPLVAEGVQQAEQGAMLLAALLAKHQLRLHHQVYCSSLLRAWQTAEVFVEQLAEQFAQPASLHSTGALAERSLGSAANLSISAIEDIVRRDPRFQALPADWKSNSHFCLPLLGAESLLDAGTRVAAYLRACVQSLSNVINRDTLVLCVGHGAAFRHAAYHLGAMAFDDIAKLSMHHGQPVLLASQLDGAWTKLDGDWKERGAAAFID